MTTWTTGATGWALMDGEGFEAAAPGLMGVVGRVGEPELARLVELRFFAGLSMEEAASTLGISLRTAQRHWSYARAWL